MHIYDFYQAEESYFEIISNILHQENYLFTGM